MRQIGALWFLLLNGAPGHECGHRRSALPSLGSGLLLGVRTVLVHMGTWPCQASLLTHPLLERCSACTTLVPDTASLWKLGPGLFLSCGYSLASKFAG